MKPRTVRTVALAMLIAASTLAATPAVAVTPAQERYCAFWRDYLTFWGFKAYAYRQCINSFR